jgi:hypothetical protein
MTKTPVRLANGQRVTSSTLYEITLELAKYYFKRTFTSYVIYMLLSMCSVYHGWMANNLRYYSARQVFSS